MSKFNFLIQNKGEISSKFLSLGISYFNKACEFVQELPYRRNKNKNDLLTLFTDNCGTCSTKHALLKRLAEENSVKDVKLILGIFAMNGENTPAVKRTLEKHKLKYIPEAHNYLRCKNEILDFTKVNWGAGNFEKDILQEVALSPEQITEYKISFHKKHLQAWLNQEHRITYSLDEIWEIREQCIKDLY
ncbi:hypothetical protein [Aurantibacillus circumpalustris]|uniref:hypothetical protein n=1 Tax=Aurantibacillus circumpalustris TaxID=3036359 RepID=UPI00295BA0BE|nr:hypothetical protein [Aurantibacillus circumpalustris]